jgi:protocatechuate 3,4-dioxygenase beta subunit
MSDHEQHDHDLGLAHDLTTLFDRRRALKLLAGAGLVTLVGCGSDAKGTAASTTSTEAGSGSSTSSTAAAASCLTIPSETAGPYPGDGSNGPDVLTQSGIVRRDITKSFGTSTTVAGGVPLTINLVVQDTGKSCAALADAAVYLWHCDREGRYSLYSQGVTNENYLRGVQTTDGNGRLSFTSIFPACYDGRWPHIHFEVYPSLSEATKAGTPSATSQIALPEATCRTVYATDGYSASVSNLSRVSLSSDMVFRDDKGVRQIPTVTGNVAGGYSIELTVPV